MSDRISKFAFILGMALAFLGGLVALAEFYTEVIIRYASWTQNFELFLWIKAFREHWIPMLGFFTFVLGFLGVCTLGYAQIVADIMEDRSEARAKRRKSIATT